MTTSVLRRHRHGIAALVLVFIAAWFGSLEYRGLFFPDEGRYAEIPREMLASGDWTTPRLNDLKYFEKPPLQYWLTALSFAAFGEDEWTARLPISLLGFVTLIAIGLTAGKLWGARAGWLAAAILGSSWGYYLCGQYLTLDMTLSAFLALALCAFVLAQREGVEAYRRFWMLGAWAAAAFAMLSKGPIALVLPGLALVCYSIAARDLRIWSRLHWREGAMLFALIAVPWFAMVQLRNPEFFGFFFIHEHIQRFLEPGHARPGPWWYYVPVVLIGFMPWTLLLVTRAREQIAAVAARGAGGNDDSDSGFDVDLFCIAWIAVVVLFFSLSQSKLPAYVVPVFPAMALWTCRMASLGANTGRHAALRNCGWFVLAVGVAIAIGASQLAHWSKFAALGDAAAAALPVVVVAAIALAIGGAIAAALASKKRAGYAIGCLVVATFTFWLGVTGFLHEVDAQFSSERLIEELTDDTKPFRPGDPFYSVGLNDPSIPFYLGRTVTLVNVRGELGPGIDAEPDKAVASVQLFELKWMLAPGQAFAVMPHSQYARLQRDGLEMSKVLEDERLVIVSRHPAAEMDSQAPHENREVARALPTVVHDRAHRHR